MLSVITKYEGSSCGLFLVLCESECGLALHRGGVQHERGQHKHLQGEEQETAEGSRGCSTGCS